METGNLDVTIDTATEGSDTLQIDQTITAGSIDITGSGAAGGDTLDVDQNLAAGTSLTLDNLQTIAVAQDVDLSAANGDLSATTNIGSITLDGTAGENEIKTTGGTGDIALGAIGNSGTASDLIVTTASGTSSGDITLNGAVTGVGYVTINAGSTTSGNTGDVAINANITAADANSGTGIDIDATNDITIAGTLTTSDGGTALDIDIDAGNEFTLSSGGFDSDDDVFITATTDDVNLAAGVTADGNIDLDAGANILQTAGDLLAGGNVVLDAATLIDLDGTIGSGSAIVGDVTIGTNTEPSTGVDMATASLIDAGGDITIEGGALTLDAITSAGSTGITVTASTGDLALNDNLTTSDGDDAGSIAVTATAGAITDGSAITLDSDDNIVLRAGTNITLNASTTVQADDDLTINGGVAGGAAGTDSLTLGILTSGHDGVAGNIVIGGVDADPSVTLAGALSANGGYVDIRGNDVSINADVTANANNGDKGIYVLGGNDVTVAGTLTTADGGTALDIDIDAGNEFTLSSGGFDSDDDVFITATTDDVNLGAGVTADGNIDLDAGANILQTAGDLLAGGNVNLDAVTTVDLDGTVGFGSAIGGNFAIGASTTSAAVDTAGSISVDGSIAITGSNITTNAAIRADADSAGDETLAISSTNGASDVLTINQSLTTVGGAVTLNAKDDVVFGAAGAISSTSGNVSVTADSDTSGGGTGGSITMASASTINAGSGTITLLADENVVLHGLTTTNATGSAVAVTSTNGSITEAGGTTEITANAVGAVTTLTAKGSIGDANADPLLDATNPLETAVSALAVTTNNDILGSEIAIDNTFGSELEVNSISSSAGQDASVYIKSSNGVDVADLSNVGDNDNLALIATAGNVEVENGGAGVIDADGELENADISVGTGTVRLVAASGFVKDSAGTALAIKAGDLLFKADQLNSETDATDVGSITTDLDPHLAVLLSGTLDVDVNGNGQALTIVGVNDGSSETGHSADLKIGDLDGDSNAITTNAGELNVIVLNGISDATADNDDITSPTLLLSSGAVNTYNADVTLRVTGNGVTNYSANGQTEGAIQINAAASLVSDDTADDLGSINVGGNVVLNGTVHANTGETINLYGPAADIIITSAMVGANAVTLDPGGFDVIVKNTGSLQVGGATASLTISNADELVLESSGGSAGIISVSDSNPGDGTDGDINIQGIRSIYMQGGTKLSASGDIIIGKDGTTFNANSHKAQDLYMENTAELTAGGDVKVYIDNKEYTSGSDSDLGRTPDDTYVNDPNGDTDNADAYTQFGGGIQLGKITSDNDTSGGGDVTIIVNNDGASGNLKLVGDINANDSGSVNNDVTLTSAGSITRSGSSSITATETLSFNAAGDLGESGSYLTFVAENVSLNISGSGNDAYLNNTPTASIVTIEGTTNDGDIRYSQTGSDLNVGDVTGGASAAGLTVGTGAILLSGSVVNLDVDSAVSASGGSFTTSGVTTSIDVDADVSVAGGSITLATDGAINLNTGDLVATGTGTVTLNADNDENSAGDVIIASGTDNDEKIRTGSGTITVEGNNVSVDDFGIISTGTVSVRATGGVYSSSAADAVADIEAGTLDIEATSVGQSSGNTLEFATSTKLDIESVGAVTINSTGNLPLGKVEITGTAANVSITSAGSITDVDGTTADDIVNADNLTLSAVGGIGSTGKTGAIEFDATTLANITNSTSGGIFLNAKGTGGLTVTTLTANTAGNVELYAEETIEVGSISAASGDVIIDTDGAIDAINNDDTADISGTNITLTANSGGIGATGVLEITASGNLAADSSDDNGLIQIDSIGAVALGLIDAGSGNVNLDSTGAITDGNDASNNITAGVLTITGNQALTDIETTVATLDLTTAATSITETNGVDIAASTISDNFILSAGGAITDSGILDVTGTSSFTDTTDAGITLDTLQSNGTVTVDGGATSIVNDSALALQGTVTGNLAATASAGGISDSGTL